MVADVYQGSPSPITGFMAAVAKAGAFAALLRCSCPRSEPSAPTGSRSCGGWPCSAWAGAAVALLQKDIKRMMAYRRSTTPASSCSGGAATTQGVSASLYYIFTYVFLVIGSFAVITVMARDGDTGHQIGDYRGLAKRHPLLALAFVALLLGQAGAPFTTGFLAKFGVVAAAVDAHAYAVASVAMVSAAVAAFFYLRVAVTMFSPVGSIGSDVDGGTRPRLRRGRHRPGRHRRCRRRWRAGDAGEEAGTSLRVLTDAPPSSRSSTGATWRFRR